jgi:1,4-alpha-glucan branching enzyme
MGGELAQWREWSEERALDWHLLEQPAHAGVQRWIADLGALYRERSALWELDADPAGWEWIDFSDAENTVVSFLRRSRDGDALLFVCNFTPVPRHGYRIGVPAAGEYRELLNSDATVYGGQRGSAGDGCPRAARPRAVARAHPAASGDAGSEIRRRRSSTFVVSEDRSDPDIPSYHAAKGVKGGSKVRRTSRWSCELPRIRAIRRGRWEWVVA